MKRQIGRQAVLVAVTTTVQRGIQYLFNRRERREIRRDRKRIARMEQAVREARDA